MTPNIIDQTLSVSEQIKPDDIAAIAASGFRGNVTLDPALLSVGSSFFLVTGVIRYDRVESQTETLLQRKNNDVEVIWQLRL